MECVRKLFSGRKLLRLGALSAYGPTTPLTRDGTESLKFKMREAYPRLTKCVPGKPIIIAEFGCDLHNRHIDVVRWDAGCARRSFFKPLAGDSSVFAGGTKSGKRRQQNTTPI